MGALAGEQASGRPRRDGATTRTLVVALCLAALGPGSAAAAPGDLDPVFGQGGRFSQAVGPGDSRANAAVVQADGKIVLAGTAQQSASSPTNEDFLVMRLNADGTLDTSFGGTGIVQTPIAAGTGRDEAFAVALDSGGTIYAAGSSAGDFAVARYTPGGALDTGFSGDGLQTHSTGTVDQARALRVQADGKVVIAGAGGGAGSGFHVLRLDGTTGALDPTFNGTGVQETKFGDTAFAPDFANALVLQPDGKLVAAGTADAASAASDVALARYNTDGTLDTAGFGAGTGKVQTQGPAQEEGSALALDPAGRLVLAGRSFSGGPLDFLVARYDTGGALDPGFSGDGIETTPFVAPDGTRFASATGVLVEPAGTIVAGGWAFSCSAAGCADYALARYTGGGALDPSFGDAGKRTYDVAGANDFASALVHGSQIQAGVSFDGTREVVSATHVNGVDAGGNGGGTTPPPTSTGAPDLHVQKIAVFGPRLREVTNVGKDQHFFWRVTVTNRGTAPAENVAVTDIFPARVGTGSIGPGRGIPESNDPALGCDNAGFDTPRSLELNPFGSQLARSRGPLGPGESLEFNLAACATRVGRVTNTASATTTTMEVGVFGNTGESTLDVYDVPDSVIRTANARRVRGQAAARGQESRIAQFDPSLGRLARVEVAVARIDGRANVAQRRRIGSCSWLRSVRRLRFRGERAVRGRCSNPVWLRARGTRVWSIRFARGLPRGRYVVLSRAVNRAGVAEVAFSARDRNRVRFRVR